VFSDATARLVIVLLNSIQIADRSSKTDA
jgi:hypothetical protein